MEEAEDGAGTGQSGRVHDSTGVYRTVPECTGQYGKIPISTGQCGRVQDRREIYSTVYCMIFLIRKAQSSFSRRGGEMLKVFQK